MQHEEYISKDLGEVAFLITRGSHFTGIQWKDSTAYFRFGDPSAASLGRDYFYGDVTVSPRIYYDNLRMIKRKLYAAETEATGKRARKA